MFIEPNFNGERRGWIEVICGSMFSGKTEELLRRIKRARFAKRTVQLFKPRVDDRYDAARWRSEAGRPARGTSPRGGGRTSCEGA